MKERGGRGKGGRMVAQGGGGCERRDKEARSRVELGERRDRPLLICNDDKKPSATIA